MARLRAVPLLLALLLLASPAWALAPRAAVEAAEEACPDLRPEPGLGLACREGAYFRIPLENGASVLTHGGDPAPTGLAAAAATATAGAVPPACVADPAVEPHGRLLYTRAADTPSRFASLEDDLRAMMLEANGRLVKDSTDRGATMRYRMMCDEGEVSVTEVVLGTASDADTFQTIMLDLRTQGYDKSNAKYWIWHDGQIDCGCAGIGTLYHDDFAHSGNGNNRGPSYGATFGYLGGFGAFVMMHENGHNMGAVQNSAPRSSGGGHCNDGLDVMCYADGGPTAAYTDRACPTRQWFDCNHDTYFDPRPSPSEYLAGRWNLGSPLNRFLQGCHYSTGFLAVGLNGVEVEDVSATTVAIAPECGGGRFALYADASSIVDDFNVCWHDVAGTLIKCNRQRYQDTGTVPAGVASARIVYALGAGARWTLSIV